MSNIDDLSRQLNVYMDPEQIQQVRRSYFYAEQAHDGQKRKSGEPYVTHPLAAAGILAEMKMDHQSLMAAMLHDVIEDTEITYDGLESQFGDVVAGIVDGVSKLTHLEFETRAEAQASNFQKMVLAMAEDIRVILVKLADRLHNMRTLGAMPPVKQRRIARETLDIYAPIAARLGMRDLQVELEDLAFQAHYPMRARYIRRAVVKARGQRKDVISSIQDTIEKRLQQEGLKGQVTGREKHLYSIYSKMKAQRKSFAEIMDVFAFRIVTESVDDCYRILGAVHNLYKPVLGRFKDYIAIPKANGYQSLHTDLFGAHDITIEVQIRTRDMDAVASQGIAEHSMYKANTIGDDSDSESAQGSYRRARKWVQGLLEMHKSAGNSMEFIDSVKTDLFPDEVYVFTPKGKIMELPSGATAVDFAYAVHTAIGNSCVSCRINRRLAPLSQPLKNGQTVEIITANAAQPNMAWLNFVVTGKARTAIRHYLKNQQRHESVALGQRLLNQFLANYGITLNDVSEAQLQPLLESSGLDTLDDLLEDIGQGNRMAYVVARQLRPDETEAEDSSKQEPMAIKGTEGMMLHYAKCCRPIPGDSIVGHISTGRGLVVHQADCRNIGYLRDDPEKCIYLEWSDIQDEEFTVDLTCEVKSHRGIIAELATGAGAVGADILSIDIGSHEGELAKVEMEVSVRDRVHLARVMKKLRSLNTVNRIHRTD